MGAKVRSGGRFYVDGHSGQPANGWKVYTYEAGSAGVLGSDDKEAYTDYTLGTAHANPIILDSRGEAEIWFNGTYLLKIYDSADNLIYSLDYYGQGEDAGVDADKLPQNGSFEIDDNGDDVPDNWTLTPGTNGTVALDTVSQAHGLKSLKFTGTDATGGGTATSDKFNVLAGDTLALSYVYKSSAVDTLNKIEVKWYTQADALISTSTALSEGAANPTSYTQAVVSVTAPATAKRAEIVLTGVDGAGTTTSGNTNFDDIQIRSATAKILESPTINTPSIVSPAITGAPTVQSKPLYGLVLLDDPVQILSSSTTGADTLLDMSTAYPQAATDGAKAVILSVYSSMQSNSPVSIQENTVYLGVNTPLQQVDKRLEVRDNGDAAAASTLTQGRTNCIVKLDANSDFYWNHSSTAGAGLGPSLVLTLIGYYV